MTGGETKDENRVSARAARVADVSWTEPEITVVQDDRVVLILSSSGRVAECRLDGT